jgi:hypothetical protein
MNGRRIARKKTLIGPPSEVDHLLNAKVARSVRWQRSVGEEDVLWNKSPVDRPLVKELTGEVPVECTSEVGSRV